MIITTKRAPIFILIIIVSVRVITSIAVVEYICRQWLGLLLIIVYVRGVIVLFIYVTSLSPYDRAKIKKNIKPIILTVPIILIVAEIRLGASNLPNHIINTFLVRVRLIRSVALILRLMATTVPKIAMNLNKGLKASK